MIIYNDTSTLPIMESFLTLQGEGIHSGKKAYFIRIAGCDIGCHWCDVKESWDPKYPQKTIQEIYDLISADLIVITGGEPLMYNLEPLTSILKKNNKQTHLETSGAYNLTGIWDWICLSPKKNKLPLKDIYNKANELKIIIFNKHDLIFAEEQALLVSDSCHLILQPEWSKKEIITPLIIDFIIKNPKWRLCLQTHKYLNIP